MAGRQSVILWPAAHLQLAVAKRKFQFLADRCIEDRKNSVSVGEREPRPVVGRFPVII